MYQLKTICTNTDCPRHSTCVQLPTDVYPTTSGEIHTLFIGQGGGREEREQCRPFIGPAGDRCKNQVIKAREIITKPVGFAFGNIIRDCIVDHQPPEEHIQFCLPFLYAQINELKKFGLRAIIPFGDKALTALIGKEHRGNCSFGEILSKHSPFRFGWNHSNENITVSIFPTHHPARLIRKGIKWNKENPNEMDVEVINTMIKVFNMESTQELHKKLSSDDPFEGLLSEPIISSNIDKVGYNKEKKELLVRFKNGGLYKYVEVPYIEYEQLVEARSAGSWFYRNIRSKFECEKINEITEEVPDNPNLQ